MASIVECDVKIEMDDSDPGPSHVLEHGVNGTQGTVNFNHWLAEAKSKACTTDIATLTEPLKGNESSDESSSDVDISDNMIKVRQ